MKRLLAWSCLILVGCGGSDTSTAAGPDVISAVDTLIDTESAALASVVDMDVDPSGRLYVADFQANQILSLDPLTGDTVRLSQPGGGPGELKGPWAIRALDDGLLVVDRGNGRVQRLAESGAFVSSTPVTPMVMRGFPFLGADGSVLIGSGGRDSCLAVVFDSTATEVRRVGTPVVVPPAIADFGEIKSQIRAGEVPADLRNDALVAADRRGGTWIALSTEAEVRRYGPDGTLKWTTAITEPEMAWSRTEFFRKNAAEDNPARFYSLRYFRDLAVVDDALWLLLDTRPDGPALVVVVGPEGSTRRLEIAAAGSATSMAVDLAHDQVFLYTYDDAQLLRARLPGDVAAGRSD